MKRCAFCAEEIQDEAIKCRFCGEYVLQPKPKLPWYFRTSVIVFALLSVGPLALPLVLYHPRYSRRAKIITTIVVLVLTYFSAVATMRTAEIFKQYYGQISQMFQ